MGLTVSCKAAKAGFDVGYAGFDRLRCKVAELYGEPFGSFYRSLNDALSVPLAERDAFYEKHDRGVEEMVNNGTISADLVEKFFYAPNTEGRLSPKMAAKVLEIIGDYDDELLYGYVGRPDCARFRDFKRVLQAAVDTHTYVCWC